MARDTFPSDRSKKIMNGDLTEKISPPSKGPHHYTPAEEV